jgi:hypothetical protein
MNPTFFEKVEEALASERFDAYRQDGVIQAVVLARYVWNMALCETFYSPLQIAEIALRNTIHRTLTTREGTEEWYAGITGLPPWQTTQINECRRKIQDARKPVTPGRMVAELNFGFWTAFFNRRHHAQTGIGHLLAGSAFPHAPRLERVMYTLDRRLNKIRELRNRVFHHERIIHWNDLDAQHAGIVELIGWISPELRDLALALDRYTPVRKAGIDPWLNKLRCHWPDPAITPAEKTKDSTIAIVHNIFDVTQDAETPFGERWGGDVFALTEDHLAALRIGQKLALDVQGEYIAFLKHVAEPPTTPAPTSATTQPQTSLDAQRGAGHGG